MTPEDRQHLLDLLVTYAYQWKKGGFTLASGKVSDEYLDCKMALSQARALQPLGDIFFAHVDPRAVAIGGLTMGADPIAINTARSSAASARALRWFSVRKNAKEYGKKKSVEGSVSPGEDVVVVDDVVTTGGSTIQAIEQCRLHGLHVVQVLVLVDREEEDGLQRIRSAAGDGVEALAMFTKSEIRRAWELRPQRG